MSDRLRMSVYGLFVLAMSLVHDPRLLALGLGLALLAAGRDLGPVLRRSLPAIVAFTGVVVAAYVISALVRGGDPWPWVLRTLLRVTALSTATVATFRRIDLLQLAGASRMLQTLAVLVLSQTAALRRFVGDARLALASRSLRRPGPRVWLRHLGATGGGLLRKAHHDLNEVSAAMASRGFYVDDDRD